AGEKKNRMDEETAGFYTRVREGYLKLAAQEPERFLVLDAGGSTNEVQMRVAAIVTEFLGKR
ncbi:MAG: dTMP kinase, partial [Acidobacteriota bacterium]|nr:dTMP kinase [Acidobacteriota bacterium]